MWKVECARCGETIEAESPEDIHEDENGDPRHEDCEYADEPDYPHSFTITIRSNDSRIKRALKQGFPHLTPRLEEQPLGHVIPDELFSLGGVTLTYRAESEGTFWDAEFALTHVDGQPLASYVPRLVYECEECGTRIDGKIVYKTDGYRPLVHDSCTESRSGQTPPQFKPVEFSHLDRTRTPEEEEEVLIEYQEEY